MQIVNALMLAYLKSFHALSQHECINITDALIINITDALIRHLNTANRFLTQGTHTASLHKADLVKD